MSKPDLCLVKVFLSRSQWPHCLRVRLHRSQNRHNTANRHLSGHTSQTSVARFNPTCLSRRFVHHCNDTRILRALQQVSDQTVGSKLCWRQTVGGHISSRTGFSGAADVNSSRSLRLRLQWSQKYKKKLLITSAATLKPIRLEISHPTVWRQQSELDHRGGLYYPVQTIYPLGAHICCPCLEQHIILQPSPTTNSAVQMSPRHWQLPQTHPHWQLPQTHPHWQLLQAHPPFHVFTSP